jgi:8-oxo-dGTP diphosphatase
VPARVGAIVGCVDGSGRVLLVKQTGGPFAGAWVLPGGRAEPGEPAEAAARRELLEETGYTAGPLEIVAHYDVRARDGSFAVDLHMFRAREFRGTPRPEADSAIRWTRGDDLALHPVVAVELADLAVIAREPPDLARALAEIGVEMRRVVQR